MSALEWVLWAVMGAACMSLLVASWALLKRAETVYAAASSVLDEARDEVRS